MDMRECAVLKRLGCTHSEKEYSMESIRTSSLKAIATRKAVCARKICALAKVRQRANWMHLSHFQVPSRVVRVSYATSLLYSLFSSFCFDAHFCVDLILENAIWVGVVLCCNEIDKRFGSFRGDSVPQRYILAYKTICTQY